ncbi:MAG: MFS transporter, partial [Phycisphaerae bacterium]|nr:MFS transporter [Phycisphaerae bacterium]
MSPWRKTFYAAWGAQILSITGFSFIMPFMPYYIHHLGITDRADAARWTGIAAAAWGMAMMVFAPIWGILADRYGRKLMVMRSMLGGAVVIALMALARNVGDIVALRMMQGILTGTIGASIALVSSVTPANRSGYAMGMMQAAVFIGAAIGPLLGGVAVDRLGFQAACLIGGG